VSESVEALAEKVRSGWTYEGGLHPEAHAALDALLARMNMLGAAADALVPYLDSNEVVPERERSALLNALYEVGLGRPR
jgi:hypothetical protein